MLPTSCRLPALRALRRRSAVAGAPIRIVSVADYHVESVGVAEVVLYLERWMARRGSHRKRIVEQERERLRGEVIVDVTGSKPLRRPALRQLGPAARLARSHRKSV